MYGGLEGLAARARATSGSSATPSAAAATTTIAGATGTSARHVNGTFDRVPGERAPGGAPVYKRRADAAWGGDVWLFLSCENTWYVGNTEHKDAREAAGWASIVDTVMDGTLPHEAPAGGWTIVDVNGNHVPQPAVIMTRRG